MLDALRQRLPQDFRFEAEPGSRPVRGARVKRKERYAVCMWFHRGESLGFNAGGTADRKDIRPEIQSCISGLFTLS